MVWYLPIWTYSAWDCEYFIRIGFVDSSFMAAFIIENAQEHYMYILILCKVQGFVFFLPFAYVLSRRVYLSFRFKWNRLKNCWPFNSYIVCKLGDNHQQNRTMARFRLIIIKKSKNMHHTAESSNEFWYISIWKHFYLSCAVNNEIGK